MLYFYHEDFLAWRSVNEDLSLLTEVLPKNYIVHHVPWILFFIITSLSAVLKPACDFSSIKQSACLSWSCCSESSPSRPHLCHLLAPLATPPPPPAPVCPHMFSVPSPFAGLAVIGKPGVLLFQRPGSMEREVILGPWRRAWEHGGGRCADKNQTWPRQEHAEGSHAQALVHTRHATCSNMHTGRCTFRSPCFLKAVNGWRRSKHAMGYTQPGVFPLLSHHFLVLRRDRHNRQARLLTLHCLALSASARTLIYHSSMCFSCCRLVSYLASIWSHHYLVSHSILSSPVRNSNCQNNFCSVCKMCTSAIVAKRQAVISLKCRPQHTLLSGSDVLFTVENQNQN